MHSLVRLVPFALALFAAIPAFASKEAYFGFQSQALNATTEDVAMRVDIYGPEYDCPLAGSNRCYQTRVSFRVTPCPPGKPCTNGGYELTYFPATTPAINLTLDRGQTYTFTGTVRSSVGAQNQVLCSIKCVSDDNIQGATYTPARIFIPPTWEVVQDHIEGNLMWVNVRILNPNLDGPCSGGFAPCIAEHYVHVAITPCPVEASWGDGCGSAYFTPVETVFHVALEIGTTYTISGAHHTFGLAGELHGGCVPSGCEYDDVAVDKVVTTSPVATQPSTWGAVKSMYRN